MPLHPTTFEKVDKTFNCHSYTMRKTNFVWILKKKSAYIPVSWLSFIQKKISNILFKIFLVGIFFGEGRYLYILYIYYFICLGVAKKKLKTLNIVVKSKI